MIIMNEKKVWLSARPTKKDDTEIFKDLETRLLFTIIKETKKFTVELWLNTEFNTYDSAIEEIEKLKQDKNKDLKYMETSKEELQWLIDYLKGEINEKVYS